MFNCHNFKDIGKSFDLRVFKSKVVLLFEGEPWSLNQFNIKEIFNQNNELKNMTIGGSG